MRQAPELHSLTEEPASEIQSEGNPSTLKKESFSELLDVANLNRDEILERVKIVQTKIDDGQSPDEQELEKFNKIKSKLEVGEAFGRDQEKRLNSINKNKINIKYLNLENIEEFIDYNDSDSECVNDPIFPQNFLESRDSKSVLNKKDIFELVTELAISKNDDNNYSIQYKGSYGKYEMKVIFKHNKCTIIFCNTYPQNDQDLFPEDVQIQMIKKLANKFNEIKEKISNITELDLEQESVINQKTLKALISHIADPNILQTPSTHPNSIPFPKTPNGNNSMNFLRKFLAEFFPKREVSFDKAKILREPILEFLNFKFKFKIGRQPQTAITTRGKEEVSGEVVAGKRKFDAIEK